MRRARDDVVAASTEPTNTMASTHNNTRFLLCRSARRPISGVAAAAASRFAVTAQLTPTMDASSWSAMIPSTGTTAVCRIGDSQDDDAQADDQCPGPPNRLIASGGVCRFRPDHSTLSDR